MTVGKVNKVDSVANHQRAAAKSCRSIAESEAHPGERVGQTGLSRSG